MVHTNTQSFIVFLQMYWISADLQGVLIIYNIIYRSPRGGVFRFLRHVGP